MVGRLTFATYNCKGHSVSRVVYIQKLMENCDILILQEHWCYESNLDMFADQIGAINIFGVSGMDESQLLLGRPYGGCAIV